MTVIDSINRYSFDLTVCSVQSVCLQVLKRREILIIAGVAEYEIVEGIWNYGCTLYTVHCTITTVHCKKNNHICTLYTVQCTMYMCAKLPQSNINNC